jgi:hypothetical protein
MCDCPNCLQIDLLKSDMSSVFWGVSVPLAFICAIMFLTELPHWLKEQWKWVSSKSTEEGIKEAIRALPSGETFHRVEETSFRKQSPYIPVGVSPVRSGGEPAELAGWRPSKATECEYAL